MAGGLLNLIAIGDQNIILNTNPTKSFFKSKYNKYTNFGLQKFRIDQNGQSKLHLTQSSNYKFVIKRYADLLMDCYLVVTLPNIWSPILKYTDASDNSFYRPYEFEWIKNIGSQLIKEVSIDFDGHTIQKFSGKYLQNAIERDYDTSKKELFNIMTGNVKELNDPKNYSNRNGNYPHAWKVNDQDTENIEPSISTYQLFIPINSWFTQMTTMAIPLICLQYNNIVFNFELRAIEELYTIKDVIYDNDTNDYNKIPRIQPKQNGSSAYQFYRFIQQPPVKDISLAYQYSENNNIIRMSPDSDIHLVTTQCFLDNVERNLFAQNVQEYLIKEIKEYNFYKINKSGKIKIESMGLISNWMWYIQRDDVANRNEWSNYTNWPYENIIPKSLIDFSLNLSNDSDTTTLYRTGNQSSDSEQTNQKYILKDFAIICDGKYRENLMPAGIYNKIEKYTKNIGCSKEGLYIYNFCLNNDPHKYQPNGSFNTNKFRTIEFEYNFWENPPLDLSSVDFQTICDPITNEIIGVTQDPTSIYQYNYNLCLFEEKYNILRFRSGLADLVYSQ